MCLTDQIELLILIRLLLHLGESGHFHLLVILSDLILWSLSTTYGT